MKRYGTLKYKEGNYDNIFYECSYEGKDPRPAYRILWYMQQNGTKKK